MLLGSQYVPGLQSSRTITTENAAPLADIQSQIAALEQRIAAAPGAVADGTPGDPAALEGLTTRLSSIESAVGKVASLEAEQKSLIEQAAALAARLDETAASAGAPATLSPELVTRLGKLEDTIATLAEAGNSDGTGPVKQVAALTGRINDVNVQMETQVTALKAAVGEQLSASEERVATELAAIRTASETRVEAIETLKAGDKRLGLDIEAMKAAREQLVTEVQQVAAAVQQNGQAVTAATESVARVETAVKTFSEAMEQTLTSFATDEDVQAAVTPLTAKLGEMTAQLSAVVASESGRQQSSQQLVVALELAELRRASERGDPIGPALARVKDVAPADLDLSAFEAGGDGVPTATELQKSFAQVARDAITADRTGAADGTVVGQLWSGAQSLVKVRRTGDIPGESTEAIVARIEDRLGAGNLTGALAEADGLQGPAREVAEPWLEKLKARVTIDQAMADVEKSLKQRLAGAPAD